MRLAATLPLATLASSFVLPDAVFNPLGIQRHSHDDQSWTKWLPSKESLQKGLDDNVESAKHGVHDAFSAVKQHFQDLQDEAQQVFDDASDEEDLDEDDFDEDDFDEDDFDGADFYEGEFDEDEFDDVEFDDVEFDENESDVAEWDCPRCGHGGHGRRGRRGGRHGGGHDGGRHGGHHGGHRGGHRGGYHQSNLTIYQMIAESNYTTKLAALVDEHEDIVKLLNSTEANYTLFAPVDSAFEHIPDDGKKPGKEFVEDLLKYHVGVGLYPAGRVLASHTIPTALEEAFLGGQPQRLRTRLGFGGVRVNFYSKVVAANIGAKNGIIHGVNAILVPPPMVGRELQLFPSKFSTLLLAYAKTDFVSYIHDLAMNGSTVFAPSNAAFDRLGPGANAFLFNTDKGLKFLKAILQYHIVANATLYSDAYYEDKGGEGGGDDDDDDDGGNATTTAGFPNGHAHIDLPTLLNETSVAVDIARWYGVVRMRVNKYIPVVVQDGVAKNGVIHVVGRVLLPPHKKNQVDGYDLDEEITVPHLMERLADYVQEEDEKDQPEMGDL